MPVRVEVPQRDGMRHEVEWDRGRRGEADGVCHAWGGPKEEIKPGEHPRKRSGDVRTRPASAKASTHPLRRNSQAQHPSLSFLSSLAGLPYYTLDAAVVT